LLDDLKTAVLDDFRIAVGVREKIGAVVNGRESSQSVNP